MKKKGIKVILYIFTIAILAVLVILFILYQSGWFVQMIPFTGHSTRTRSRNTGEEIGDKYSDGTKRWRDGNWADSRQGTFKQLPEGVVLNYSIDITIIKGRIKFVVFDIGKDIKVQEANEISLYHLGECERVYEQEISESGNYQIDLSILENNETYYITTLETVDGENEYQYAIHAEESAPRWYYIHDNKLSMLPFIKKKYQTSLTSK